MMNKSTADPSGNYADYLADTVEANKDSFSEDELKTLTDDLETIDKRMKKAVGEIEMMQNYDYAVVNDEVPKAAEKIKTIIRAERWRVKRFLPDYKKQLKLEGTEI